MNMKNVKRIIHTERLFKLWKIAYRNQLKEQYKTKYYEFN